LAIGGRVFSPSALYWLGLDLLALFSPSLSTLSPFPSLPLSLVP